MSPIAAKLTDADMKDIAASRVHCGSCHLPSYTGQNHIPRLAGQQYDYLVKELRGFKTGDRPDIDGMMSSSAQPLTEQEIRDIAWYLSGLR